MAYSLLSRISRLAALVALWCAAYGQGSLPAAAPVDFARDVLPILKTHCFDCHAGERPEAGRRLDVRGELLGESDGRPVVVVGDAAKSRLVQLVSGALPKERMPPKDEGEPLSAEQVAVLLAWIDQGLQWDDKLLPPPRVTSAHWAFQPVAKPRPPQVANRAWPRTPVDLFIAAEHEAQGLAPAAEADRRTLIRRLSLDLAGLPPTPEEVAEFERDGSPDAYERLVERMLASPHYGERWGRHWLDLARYADTEGYESNHPRPFAWRYRDYVVASFNADRPHDEFLLQQIAGDELRPASDENLIATGFLAAARLSSNEEDKPLQRNQVLVDVTNMVGSGVLGLTVGCAQCHNHKFDPLSQRDYYRLYGLFVRGQPVNAVLKDERLWAEYQAAVPPEYEPAVQLKQAIFDRARAGLFERRRQALPAEQRAAFDKPEADRTAGERELARQADLALQILVSEVEKDLKGDDKQLYDLVGKRIAEMEKKLPAKPQTWAWFAPGAAEPRELVPSKGFYPLPYDVKALAQAKAHLYVRGEVHDPGPAVPPGWPAVLGGELPPETAERGPRRAFVEWLVNPKNPLTGRVWANRVWQQHFGRGLVPSAGDFGLKGERPSHPALLDWLAAELVAGGWSTKHLHRLILLSATYRQSAVASPASRAADPDNRWLTRWPRRRLEAEAIRDSLLAASGELDRSFGGPGIAADQLATTARRTLYLHQKRDDFAMIHRLFDGPTTNESCSRRDTTTVALQPLHLLNSPTMLRRAAALATRAAELAGPDRALQIRTAYRLTLSRPPTDTELASAESFLTSTTPRLAAAERATLPPGDSTMPTDADTKPPPPTPMTLFCQVLLNLNEFVYIE